MRHFTRAKALCKDKRFQAFARAKCVNIFRCSEENAKNAIYQRCGVSSEELLDKKTDAAIKFQDLDRRFRIWLNNKN